MGEARDAARAWVAGHVSRERWFAGAYFTGSTVGLPDSAEVPLGSDTDVMVVTTDPEPPAKPGKFLHRGALVEISLVPLAALEDPEAVLSDYHLAGPFRADTLIADPTGRLTRLRATVAERFAAPAWVRRRYRHALGRATEGLTRSAALPADPAPPDPDTVIGWLFPTGITTHALLVAGLRNPTVRLRYLRVRELLAEHGLSDAYPPLLDALGCAELDAGSAESHLAALADAFDAACAVARTPFLFRSDISRASRPIAVDASRALIRAGRQREVLFWLVATYARCQLILAADAAPGERERHTPGFAALLADLGVPTTAALAARSRHTLRTLPSLTETCESLLASRAPAAPA
ncbi:hypothetical protein SAMN06297387_105167 [Streptomyces zhaozhouensis]|uniref:Nucleotidyltransferase domain-containing protein n=2 Tax=Streptomyces zhaozhouensis TaxID=1300267 RepID=A0A286DUK9_9ACTN|nr:hypothetical protein SAMN06297387_105167 [Streptomyces zhaozhouensis]